MPCNEFLTVAIGVVLHKIIQTEISLHTFLLLFIVAFEILSLRLETSKQRTKRDVK